jgi:hypothetical protein
MQKLLVNLLVAAALFSGVPRVHATGYLGQDRWLDGGGIASDMSPEFYWAEEVKRLALPFLPPEKRRKMYLEPSDPEDFERRDAAIRQFTEQVDLEDFDYAIAMERVVSNDPQRAKALHRAARDFITQAAQNDANTGNTMPNEVNSEFADYHRGALFFARKKYEDAIGAWQELLNRPVDERYHRTIWATFMAGKAALKLSKNASAIRHFEQTRQLAKKNIFADSLGLAAESYGWEARAEWKSGHLERAAELYLTQLAMGDESAVISLKALIPDRESEERTLYHKEISDDQALAELESAAKSPLLRKLITVHILADESQQVFWGSKVSNREGRSKHDKRSLRWLNVVEKSAPSKLEDAEYLGWMAYTSGQYQEANRWLKLADPNSARSLWLKSKLLRRNGKNHEAAEAMAVVFRSVLTETEPSRMVREYEGGSNEFMSFTTRQSSAGDFAALHLSRGDFITAMDVFFKGDLWQDGAFIADRVLRVDELQKFVDAQYPRDEKLRWLLGRRLVREGKVKVAHPYFPDEHRKMLEQYEQLLEESADLKKPVKLRARTFFEAAWITRYFGMELMGTQMEPDGFKSKGEFHPGELDLERRRELASGSEPGEFEPIHLFIAATKDEKDRIQKSAPDPDQRFHYRYAASELAWKAALLLPDGSEELADVLNCAGHWIRNDNSKRPDRFYFAIEKRCSKTVLGKQVIAKHWFLEPSGVWSTDLKKTFAEN